MERYEKEIASLGSLFPAVSIEAIRNIHENVPPENRVIKTLEHLLNSEDDRKEHQIMMENRRYAELLHVLFPIYSEHKILKKLRKYRSCADRWKVIVINLLRCAETEDIPSSGTKRKSSENLEGESTEPKRVSTGLKDDTHECNFHAASRTTQDFKNNRCFNNGFHSNLPLDCADVRIKLNLKDNEKLSVNISTSKPSEDVVNLGVSATDNRSRSNQKESSEKTQQENQIPNNVPIFNTEEELLSSYEKEICALFNDYVKPDSECEMKNDSYFEQAMDFLDYQPIKEEKTDIEANSDTCSVLSSPLNFTSTEGCARQKIVIDQIPGPSTYYPERIEEFIPPPIETEPHDLPPTSKSSTIRLVQDSERVNGIPGPSTYNLEKLEIIPITIKTEPQDLLPEETERVMNGMPGPSTYNLKKLGIIPITIKTEPQDPLPEETERVMNGLPGPSTYNPEKLEITPITIKTEPHMLPTTSTFSPIKLRSSVGRVTNGTQGPTSIGMTDHVYGAPGPSTSSYKPHREGRQNFDLIEYLVKTTGQSEARVTKFCIQNRLDLFKQPSAVEMDRMHRLVVNEIDDDDEDLDYSLTTDDFSDDEIVTSHFEPRTSITRTLKTDENNRGKKSMIPRPKTEVIDLTSRSEKLNAPDNLKIISRVTEVFPDVDPDFVRRLYEGTPMQASSEAAIIDTLIEKLLETPDYPKRPTRAPSPEKEIDPEEQLAFIKELLPDADPTYLQMKVSELSPAQLKVFVSEALETRNYPTMKEYLRNQQLSSQTRQYTTEFSVENYVKLVPDPVATFNDPARGVTLNNEDLFYVETYFRNKFNRLPAKIIASKLGDSLQPRVYQMYRFLIGYSSVSRNLLRSKRPVVNLSKIVCKNIPLLQELAFIEHETEILQYIEQLKLQKEEERGRARAAGLMKTCSCCFEDEVMPDELFFCENGCICCKQCIVKSSEVAFGEGKLEFPCIGGCQRNFELSTLQRFLPPNLFSKIAQKKAVQEVKAAGIEDLESCPFCDFATIPSGPPETNKIFACQNPECLKESCRLCKESSHVPLRCDEVEKDEDVKKRVFIENKMTEALLRKCWKCGISFYKEEGCNKMTCSCGANMCYVCGKPVTDYKHFNGIGGDRFDLCPLYSDTLKMNQQNVLDGALKAKEEIGVSNSTDLKIDPTSDIQQFYRERAKKVPREPYLDQLNARGAMNNLPNFDQQLRNLLADEVIMLQQNVLRIQLPNPRDRRDVQRYRADRLSVRMRQQRPN